MCVPLRWLFSLAEVCSDAGRRIHVQELCQGSEVCLGEPSPCRPKDSVDSAADYQHSSQEVSPPFHLCSGPLIGGDRPKAIQYARKGLFGLIAIGLGKLHIPCFRKYAHDDDLEENILEEH